MFQNMPHHPGRCLFTYMLRNLFFSLSIGISSLLAGQSPSERASVKLSSTVQSFPPTITLDWSPMGGTSSLSIYRKLKSSSSWGSAIASPSASSVQWVDNNVTVGVNYEYRVQRVSGGVQGNGYVSTGIQVELPDYRGKIILLVDNTLAASLSLELEQLTNDLRGDGWSVIQ